jgi:hypothetical protein
MDLKENIVESNVALAMVIGEHSPLVHKDDSPKTPPRKTSLLDWAATPSPVSPPLSDLPKPSTQNIFKSIITSNDLFKSLEENESRSLLEQNSSIGVLEENSSRFTYQTKSTREEKNQKYKNIAPKMKYPKKKFIKTERKNLNNWIIYFGLSGSDSIFGSESKGNLIRKMQKEKKLDNNIPKEVDITDGRSKNIYTPEQFVSILNYIIQSNKIQDLDFDYAKKKDMIEIEENHLYFDNSEEILNQKLIELNIEGRLNI